MLVYCSCCVYNLFIRAENRGRWPASVKLILPYLTYCQSVFRADLPSVVVEGRLDEFEARPTCVWY